MKKWLLAISLTASAVAGFAQSDRFWAANNESREGIVTDKAVARQSFPTSFKLFNLNLKSFQQAVMSIVGNKAAKRSTVISLPNAEGNLEQFEVFEASNFEPALQAKFPEIRAYSGRGITDRTATLKLSISPQGIETMVFRTVKDNEFMEPYSQDQKVYAVYSSQRSKSPLWKCSTHDQKLVSSLDDKINNLHITQRSGGDLKVMRLAQSVTAEYSNYFGATNASQVGLVLAAINNTLARCNGVYEKDLAVHLNLIANDTAVIFYNASTDPYDPASTGAGGTWNAQLQSTLTSKIGEANYDIGHLFGASGGGGNAGCIGCICTNNQKGSGFTSPANNIPKGDDFDIDYVVHEVGHQMGGNHTFSMNNEGTGVNVEPGSGITIMGYAGITSYDVAAHSIDIYHAATIGQIQANLLTKTCPVTNTIVNATPVVAAVNNYTIPKSTPFALTGSATDANPGDTLTYCWEEMDNASSSQTNAASVASATKASGPNWVSFKPSTSPTRLFPRLATILAGLNITGPMTGGTINTEALSSVARTLKFRLTVRDNAVYTSTAPYSVGQTQFTNTTITVSAASGPFAVTSPNTAISWVGTSSQAITWSVNSTTAAPVSCANVKISLSTDGGQTFPTVLIASTPNDGTETLTIPNTPTTTARIKVEAADNIFFDISNTNFTITAPSSSCGAPTGLTSSAITPTGATVSWTAVTGAAGYTVDYKLASASTWTNAATATANTSVTISGLSGSSLYDWRVKTLCTGDSSVSVAAQFTTGGVNPCTGTDAYEPNNTLSGATMVPVNTSVYPLISSATDNDYLKFKNSTTAANIKVTVANLPADYNVKLYGPTGLVVKSSSNTGTADESIIYNTSTIGTYKVYVYGVNGAFNATNCYKLTVQTGASPFRMAGKVASTEKNAIKVFPNPAKGSVALSLDGYDKGDVQVSVMNQSGTRVFNKTLNANAVQNNTQIDITSLPTGMYFVKVQQGEKSNMEKVYVTK